jgi:hypothetical protein
MGSMADVYGSVLYHVICYGIGAFISWLVFTGVTGSAYVPVYTMDLLLLLLVGAAFYVPVAIFGPFAFVFIYGLVSSIVYFFDTGRRDRARRKITDEVAAELEGKTRAEIVAEFPFVKRNWTRDRMIAEIAASRAPRSVA